MRLSTPHPLPFILVFESDLCYLCYADKQAASMGFAKCAPLPHPLWTFAKPTEEGVLVPLALLGKVVQVAVVPKEGDLTLRDTSVPSPVPLEDVRAMRLLLRTQLLACPPGVDTAGGAP
jgi:hypothetical protein